MKMMKLALYVLISGIVLYSCRKEDTVAEQPGKGGGSDTTTITVDSTV